MKLSLPPHSPKARVWVAFSGGLDSTVLLHALHAQGVPNLRAVHVHHGLQAAADDWVRHARRFCRELGVPLTVRRVTVRAQRGEGPEAAAREARHAALAALLRPGDLLLTAHHRDDQAETVLLRALRGAGIAGLAAMAPVRPCGRGQLARPLLNHARAELQAYAETQGLRWIEDPHNRDSRYARSLLRHEILPRLSAHWPQAGVQLARLATRAGEAAQLLAELAALDLASARTAGGLSIAALRALSPARRRNALYHGWLGAYALPPSTQQLEQLDRELLGARGDAQPCLVHAQGEVRRYRDQLYWLPGLPPVPDGVLHWPARRRRCALPDGIGTLQASRVPPVALTVRFARGGERLRPERDRHTRSLKALCQDAGVPVWVRQRLPLVCENETLIAIAGYWRSARAAELGLAFHWQTALPGAPSA